MTPSAIAENICRMTIIIDATERYASPDGEPAAGEPYERLLAAFFLQREDSLANGAGRITQLSCFD